MGQSITFCLPLQNKEKVSMKFFTRILREYPVSCMLLAIIWVVCMIPIPETPLSHVSMIDKWTHTAMYALFSLSLWCERAYRHKSITSMRAVCIAFVFPLLMGGLIEIAQATCTGGNRSGDWLDFLADGIGAVAATAIGILPARRLSNRRKGSSTGENCKNDGRP